MASIDGVSRESRKGTQSGVLGHRGGESPEFWPSPGNVIGNVVDNQREMLRLRRNRIPAALYARLRVNNNSHTWPKDLLVFSRLRYSTCFWKP